MRTLVENLLAAQKALRAPSPAEKDALLLRLQKSTPASVLAHFLRLISQGRNGVTVVRHGVCSGCHLKVPSSVVAALSKPTDLHLCENCGSYLLLAPEEMPSDAPPTVPTACAVRRERRRRQPLAA
jgi:predicted  nucleic acid-binding Zn-ribbon protein